ncbi:MAG: S9 family peptidase [Chloroflexi bacterium]|nr:S9 family peptidase [Chloroflexota bacterium]
MIDSDRIQRQYGLWDSPLSARALAGDTVISNVQWLPGRAGAAATLVWLEKRGANSVIVLQQGEDAPRDLTATDVAIRAQVNYGGGEFGVSQDTVYYTAEQRIWRQPIAGGAAQAITPAFAACASPTPSPDGRWLVYVYHYEGADGLALVPSDGSDWPRQIATDSDFVTNPTWSPSGDAIAYITWDHPNMPWNGTELRLLQLDLAAPGGPRVRERQTLAGDRETAIFQPEFSPDGRWLTYTSDESGFSQLYALELSSGERIQLTDAQAEHGAPGGRQGHTRYGWVGDGEVIYLLRNELGFSKLCRLDWPAKRLRTIDTLAGYSDIAEVAVGANEWQVAILASDSRRPARLLRRVPGGSRIVRRTSTEAIPRSSLAAAQAIQFPGHDGETVHALYYEPTHSRYSGIGKPPLIVHAHGGPIGQQKATYNGAAQFFATRGYAYLSVNYRGSLGYGRAYMSKILGHWGVYDTEDCAAGARHLIEADLVDPERIVIYGGSAGGFTVLNSLVNLPGFYAAGVNLFGVSNQFLLAAETHKYEARYLDSLLGPLPESAALYRERSPIFHAERITDPLLIFQGSVDIVVPPNQSESVVAILKRQGVPHEYHLYEGEGHGWRRPETTEHCFETMLRFLEHHVLYR